MGARWMWLTEVWFGLVLMAALQAAALPSPDVDVPDPPANPKPPAPHVHGPAKSSVSINESKNAKSSDVQTSKEPPSAINTPNQSRRTSDGGNPSLNTVSCGTQKGLCHDNQTLPLSHQKPQKPAEKPVGSTSDQEHDSKLPGSIWDLIVKPDDSIDQGQAFGETSGEPLPEGTTTIDPFLEFCQEMCREGIGGPECNCPGHPIGRRSAEGRLLPVDFSRAEVKFSSVNHPRFGAQRDRSRAAKRLDFPRADVAWGEHHLPRLLTSVWEKNHHLTVGKQDRVMSPFCLALCRRGWRSPSCRCHNSNSHNRKFRAVPSTRWPKL